MWEMYSQSEKLMGYIHSMIYMPHPLVAKLSVYHDSSKAAQSFKIQEENTIKPLLQKKMCKEFLHLSTCLPPLN